MTKSISFKNNDMMSEKLKESEMRYRRLFETAHDGILILDFESGRITDANPFIINIIDYPLKKILGKELWEIGLFDNKKQSEKAFTRLKKKGYIRFEDMPIQRRNGKITEVEFISNVYLVNNKKVIQCNIRDITERKRTETDLLESERNLKKQNAEYHHLNFEYVSQNEELTKTLENLKNINDELLKEKARAEESDRLKSAFLANMSHEIRTPMNAIVGFAGLLKEPELTHENLSDFVQIINSSSHQLMSVISDIIDISKLDTGQIAIDSEWVDINKLMHELYATYKIMVGQNQVSLHYFCSRPNDLVQVETDGNRIRQVFCNLLNNAIKFTSSGKIEFGYAIEEKFLAFYVKDTGMGIAPENQKVIFQRFRQLEPKNTEISSGNGLGLSISKALVEKLGGHITVQSEIGSGSTFIFTIPYTENYEKTIIPKDGISQGIHWDEKTVLVVEDEVNSHIYIEEILKTKNVKMVHAWDGSEAVEKVKNHSGLSLVLMDIKMPIMNGYEALKHIKQISPHLPVIAQTAYALSHEKSNVLHAGFDGYISKPITKEALLQLMAGYLN